MKRLDGKVAVVMGAGSPTDGWGIGSATAMTFGFEGAHVVCVDGSREAAERTVELIRDEGGSASAVVADARDDADVAEVFASVANDHGRLDVLDNNVDVPRLDGGVGRADDEWDLLMTANVTTAYLAMKHAVPLMRAGGSGSIINLSSVAAIRYGGPLHSGYAAAKAALNHLTRVTAAEYASDQIRVNAILPGLIRTPMLEPWVAPCHDSGEPEHLWLTTVEDVPMGRAGEAWDVAHAALFFASEASRFVTGMELVVDGGMSLCVGAPTAG